MSAFIISPNTMDRVINGLALVSRDHKIVLDGQAYSLREREDISRLGRRLYQMNRDAVCARYGNDSITEMDPNDSHETYMFTSDISDRIRYSDDSRPEWFDYYKAIQCFLYQCSEGDVPKTTLFTDVNKAAADLAHSIISNLDAYEEAPWD